MGNVTKDLKNVKNARELFDLVMAEGFYVNFCTGDRCRKLQINVSSAVSNHLASFASASHDVGEIAIQAVMCRK